MLPLKLQIIPNNILSSTVIQRFFATYRDSDNLPYAYYEKFPDGTVRDVTDEIPFEIPESWEWVRLGGVIQLLSGQDLTPDKYNACGQGIPYITGASNIENNKVLINRWTTSARAIAEHRDLLLTCKGTVGLMAFLEEDRAHIARQIMAIKFPFIAPQPDFLRCFLDTLVTTLKATARSMIPGIARDDVLPVLFPLPPLAEQQRIVERIEELLPHITDYDATEQNLATLNDTFPEQLKKSILQWAIQGKLVPQDPDDEPASVLLKRIRAEKESLIKEGKLKRNKNESIIYRGSDNSYYEKFPDGTVRNITDEIPFEIPASWEWMRLGAVFNLQAGKFMEARRIGKSQSKGQYPCFGGNGIRGYADCCNRSGDFPIIGRQGALCGNINYAQGDFYATEHAVVVELFGGADVQWALYLLEALNLNRYATATAQPGLAVGTINNVLAPVPPVSEQSRIARSAQSTLMVAKTT